MIVVFVVIIVLIGLVMVEMFEFEKDELIFGFIKLIDMVFLVVVYE